uniref:Uncharacterized protein n=1 Tax=Acrobeloides nanus TaxID=290746 RepID=A0A914EMW1_9BILA
MTKFLLFLFLYTITTVDATLKCTYITDNNVMDCVNFPPVTHCLKYILFDGLVQYTRTCDYNNICGSIGNTCVYNQSFPNIGLTRKLCCCDTDNCNAPEPQSNWRRCMNNVNLQHNDQEKICADGNDFCMTLSNSGNDRLCFGRSLFWQWLQKQYNNRFFNV